MAETKGIFLIEKLLKEQRGAKSELARILGVTPRAIENFLNNGAKTVGNRLKYTEAYNLRFETNYSFKELFNIIDN